jgi:DNA-binding winged helix-turn-helix (wHTH) protein/TolB-like protein
MDGDFKVGEWLVQPRVGTITKGDQEVGLEPKVMEVLLYLAQHPDDVLPKERIIQAVWGDTFVTNEVLTNAISELRRAFGDDARNPHTIQTLPRRGYRLMPSVTPLGQEQPEAAVPASNQLWQQSVIVILAAALLLMIVVILWWSWPASPDEPIDSIAILPFKCTSEDEEFRSLAFGLAASVGSSLSRLEGLKIKPAAGLIHYRKQEIDPRTVADDQNVSAVLTGSVAPTGNNLLVTVNLIDGKDGTEIWGDTYRGKTNEILAVEEEVIQQVAGALSIHLTVEESEHLVQRGTDNLEAYRAFSRGNYRRSLWFRDNLEEKIHEAIGHWKRAVDLDPGYQEAYWRLANAYFFLVARRKAGPDEYYPDEYYEIARTYFEKVVETGPSTVLAHHAKTRILWSYDRKWEEAEREYRKFARPDLSIEVDPERTVVVGSQPYLEWMGHREELLSRAERGLERMDPKSPHQHLVVAYHFFWLGDWDKALRFSHETLSLEPDLDLHSMHWIRSISYGRLGMEQRALEEILTMVDSKERIAEIQNVFDHEGLAGVRRYGFEEIRRDRGFARALKAMEYAETGESDRAIETLKEMWSLPLEGWEHAPSNRLYDPLRSDPRFEELLRKQNLPEEAIQRHLAIPEKIP